MKRFLKRLLLTKGRKATIAFIEGTDGKITIQLKMDSEIPIGILHKALDKIKRDVQTNPTRKTVAAPAYHQRPPTRQSLLSDKS
jgi:hypothetical protein